VYISKRDKIVGLIILAIFIGVIGAFSAGSPCTGEGACLSGKITKVVDGDTVHINNISIRFALASAPELHENGGPQAKRFVERICPVGSDAIADEDGGQLEGSFDRMVAKITCNGIILNEEILEKGHGKITTLFCSKSEFSGEAWALKFGC